MLNYATFPNAGMACIVQDYFEKGDDPGEFMASVLCNDLKEACGHADHVNRYLLFDIVSWFYNEAPVGSWGSPEAFESVVRGGGVMGVRAPRAAVYEAANVRMKLSGVALNDEAVGHMETTVLEQGNVSDDR